ncbi:hypothetical protein [Streptomyces sp. NPDC058394]|uniref:hypothetical protein n=1 Tax=Streptomyces sp. NPDC058394 TaxID=3346477 RepID=UPI003665AEEC
MLHDAARGGGEGRAVSRVLADRLLAVGVADLPQPGCGYGGRSVDAAPAMRHIRHLMGSHPGLSMSVLARAAGMAPSTLAAALKDVEAGRPRRVQASAAERLLALGSGVPLPEGQARRCDAVDAAPVATHVHHLQLRYDGAGLALIARTAGVNPSSLSSALADHAQDPARGINRNIAARVLAVTDLPAPAFPRHADVTTTGLIRRVQALCALGWTLASIGQAGGTTPRSLCDLLRTQRSTSTQRSSVLAAWSELSHRPGPSVTARRRAATKGWAPPLAWEEHTIDHPAGTPSGTRILEQTRTWTPELLHYELEFLTRLGLGRAQALQRLSLSTKRARALLDPPVLAHNTASQPTTPAQQKDAPAEEITAWEEARRQQSSERICVEHAGAEHKQRRPRQRSLARREYHDETHLALAALDPDRTAEW